MSDRPKPSDFIILSCRLHSGRMESSVQIPLDVDEAQRDKFVAAWVKMMEQCVAAGKSE